MKSLKIFEDVVVQGQALVNWSSRTRTFLKGSNTGWNYTDGRLVGQGGYERFWPFSRRCIGYEQMEKKNQVEAV